MMTDRMVEIVNAYRTQLLRDTDNVLEAMNVAQYLVLALVLDYGSGVVDDLAERCMVDMARGAAREAQVIGFQLSPKVTQ